MNIQPNLLFSMLFAIISASIYFYIGWKLSKRMVSSSEAQLAWKLFTVWWYALALISFSGALLNLFGALSITNLSLFVTATYINILFLCIALWGLVYYLVYLLTGNKQSLLPLTIFYFIYYVFLMYYITASMPEAVNVGRWSTTLEYHNTLTGPFITIILVFLLLPQVIGAIFYFFLYFRVKERTQKFRIFLVSWSIILWFLSPLIAVAVEGLDEQDWWQIVSRLIGLLATLTILTAYLPPRWLRQRFGIYSVTDEARTG